MRNLLLTIDYPPNRGGVARYLQALILTYPTRFEVISDVSKILSDHGWPRWVRALSTLRNRRGDFDQLFISHLHPLGLVALIAKLLWRKPYVLMLHGFDFRLGLHNPWKRFLTRRVLNGASLVVCNSKALALDVQAFQLRIRKPLVVYPTLPDHLQNAVSKTTRSDHFTHRLRVLTVARLVLRKNHAAMIEAVHDLDGVEYTIVGDGPERERLQRLIREHGLEDCIHLRTDVSDEELAQAYTSADIFVLPVLPDAVDVEGFGIVYLEAAAAGLPIIATHMRGVEEALCPEGTIELDEPTPQAIASALRTLQDDPERRVWMGQANRAFVKRFSREHQFGKLESYV